MYKTSNNYILHKLQISEEDFKINKCPNIKKLITSLLETILQKAHIETSRMFHS